MLIHYQTLEIHTFTDSKQPFDSIINCEQTFSKKPIMTGIILARKPCRHIGAFCEGPIRVVENFVNSLSKIGDNGILICLMRKSIVCTPVMEWIGWENFYNRRRLVKIVKVLLVQFSNTVLFVRTGSHTCTTVQSLFIKSHPPDTGWAFTGFPSGVRKKLLARLADMNFPPVQCITKRNTGKSPIMNSQAIPTTLPALLHLSTSTINAWLYAVHTAAEAVSIQNSLRKIGSTNDPAGHQ